MMRNVCGQSAWRKNRLDNLNVHQSEALVRWVAEREGIDQKMVGVKGKSAIKSPWVEISAATVAL